MKSLESTAGIDLELGVVKIERPLKLNRFLGLGRKTFYDINRSQEYNSKGPGVALPKSTLKRHVHISK